MTIDLDKPLYAKDKESGDIHPVSSIEIPAGCPSGKDIIVCVGDDYEWRAITEIEFMPQGWIPDGN